MRVRRHTTRAWKPIVRGFARSSEPWTRARIGRRIRNRREARPRRRRRPLCGCDRLRRSLAGAAGVTAEGLLLEPRGPPSREWLRFQTPTGRRRCSPDWCRNGRSPPIARQLGGQRHSSRRADAHQPRRHVFRQPAGRLHEPAAPRIHLSTGVRNGPAHHRLRSAESRSGRRSVRTAQSSARRSTCRLA